MVYVHAKEEVIREKNELFSIMKKGIKTRKIGCTDMNERSSRSHTIFKLVIQSQNKDSEGSYTESSLSLVDLAGSERVGQMNMKGERQTEGVCINKSLTTLGLVIRKLSENEQFINYRDSKLTRLLQHSLGGNSRTLIICTITVAAAEETKSTLEFAQRAKYVKNRPIINEKVTDKDQLKQYAHLCQDYKGQIEKLRLEKLERETTINALEDKISNICLFTSGNIDNNVNVSKIPRRRHTLGYYKPFRAKPLSLLLNSAGSDESSDEDGLNKHDSPIKSDIIYTGTDEDDNANTDTRASTPSKFQGVPETTKITTPSPVLRMQKVLLEESYDSLKTFTNYEKQLLGQYDEIEELKELTNRLRSENLKLKQQDKQIFDQLVLLRRILEGKTAEEIRKTSLDTITEEDFEFVSDTVDPTSDIQLLDRLNVEMRKTKEADQKYLILNEENKLLNQQLVEKENIISSWTNEKGKMKAKFTTLAKENEQLKNQIENKNLKLDELETHISQHKDIKEAELEILTNKIKQLTEYKEEMYKQLSDRQQSRDDYVHNTLLIKNLDSLRTDGDQFRELAEYNIVQSAELKEENHRLKTELPTKVNLEKPVNDISENNKSLESEKETTDLRQVVAGLESQLNTLKFKYNELENQHPLQEIKKIERLTNVEIEYTTITNHIRDVVGEDLDIIDYVNSLKRDYDNFKLKVGNSEKLETELNCTIVELTKKLSDQDTLKASMNRALDERVQEIKMLTEKYSALKEQLEAKLLELDTQQKQNNALNSQLSQYNEVMNHYSLLERDNNRLKSELEDVMFQLSGEHKEVENINQMLEEKSLVISDLEKYILHLKEHVGLFETATASLQEFSNVNVTLRESLIKKEELEHNTLQLNHNNEIPNNLPLKNKNVDVKSTQTEKESEEMKTLEDKCLSQEQQLKTSKEQLNNMLKELNDKTRYCNNLVAKSTTQEFQIESLKERLNNKILELDEKSELYNNMLVCYADKNLQIEYLQTENYNLKIKLDQQQHEASDLHQLVTQRCADKNALEKVNAVLKQRIDSYIVQNTTLENQLDNFKSQLNTKITEINKKVTEAENLKTENADLKNQLNTLSQKHLALKSMQEELKILKDNSFLKQQVDQLSNENINTNLELSRLITETNKKQQQIVHLKEMSERQAEEIRTLENDNTKLAEQMEVLPKELVNMKRQLDTRSEELSHLKEKYNALEVQFNDCQDTLRCQNQELENHRASQNLLESVTLVLKQEQQERKFKSDELKFAAEELERLRRNTRNVDTLQNELEQYKVKLQKIHQNYEGNITLLNGEIFKLTGEKQDLEKKIYIIENRIPLSGQMLITENQCIGAQNQLEEELLICKPPYASDLESQLELEKSKVEYLTEKVQQSEADISNLQEKVSDLIQYKKRMQEKVLDGSTKEMSLPRLSNEGRPLSPNELRRMKRQSIHDQRRGLVGDFSESLESSNIDCSDCKELRARLGQIEEKNKDLRVEIENLKKENVFLDGENEDMLKMIKDIERSEAELFNQLESYKKLTDFSSGEDELRLLQVKYNEVINKQTELEIELLHNKKLVAKLKNTIADMESNHLETEYKHDNVEKELRRQLDDYRSNIRKAPPSTEDKETQATCNLNEQYKKVKKLAQIRRQEGNYLRAKLNLAPDCAVLPEDVQRQPTNV